MTTFTIIGQVIDQQSRQGIAGLRVEVWDKDLLRDDLITAANTDEYGRFRTTFDESRFQDLLPERRPDLYFKVYQGDNLIKSTKDKVLENTPAGETTITIEVTLPPDHKPPAFIIHGRVTWEEDGTDAQGVIVRAFDRDLRREELLGEAVTNEEGQYEIDYSADSFTRAEKRTADLVIRVYTRDGTLLGESSTRFNAGRQEEVDLAVVRPRDLTRYEKLLALIDPILIDQGVTWADLTEEDVAFLIRDFSGEEIVTSRDLAYLSRGAQLAQETELPHTFFYGVAFVRDLPQPLELEYFLEMREDTIREAVTEAVETRIVPPSLLEEIDDILARLEMLRFEHGFLTQRQINGRLLDQANEEPLVRYQVQAIKPEADERALGFDLTDGRGLFTIPYLSPPDYDHERLLRLVIINPEGEEIFETELTVAPDQSEVIDILVPIPPVADPANIPLEALVAETDLRLPGDLQDFLAENDLQTLLAIRNTGGLRQMADLPLPADDPAVKILDAHANLTLLSTDMAHNQMLIEHGYYDFTTVARQPLTTFIRAVGTDLGDRLALATHTKATAETKTLNNILVGLQSEHANGFSLSLPEAVNPNLEALFPEKCSCEDCEAAVSPLAYLADLLDYALGHLAENGNLLQHISWLTDRFHQPFAELPASCEAMDRKVRQVRLCIEVLRRHIPNFFESTTYLHAAYFSLLARLGTSYEELRLIRAASQKERQALANRLGLTLSATGADELDQLYRQPDGLSEAFLEEFFGLASTIGDVLSEGAKKNDEKNQVSRWNLDHAEWGWNVDDKGSVYGKLNQLGNDFQLELFRDTGQSALVASGKRSSPDGPVRMVAMNGRNLSGHFIINYKNDDNLIEIVAIPRFTSWRLQHLRQLWQEQDYPVDAYSTEQGADQRPVVDPDVIGPDDFRTPVVDDSTPPVNEAFNLWLHRRGWVDERLELIKSLQKNVNGEWVPDMVKMFAEMQNALTYPNYPKTGSPISATPWSGNITPEDFQTLFENLTDGVTAEDSEGAKRAIQDELNLTVESFTRLLELNIKDQLWLVDPDSEALAAGEWREVYSILVQAQKRSFFTVWIKEEKSLTATFEFGPHHFWPSLREPEEGVWPPAPEAASSAEAVWPSMAMFNQEEPLIDPDKVELKELPDTTAGSAAIHLWQVRQRALDEKLKELEQVQVKGFTAVLSKALGQTPPSPSATDWDSYLTALANNLADPNQHDAAVQQILDELHMEVEAFEKLFAFKDTTPTPEEWAELYPILVQAHKVENLFEDWLAQEVGFWTAKGLIYGRVVKARLPRWRASAEIRQTWRQALLQRSASPIIDPDLITEDYLRNILFVSEAVQIWQQRWQEVEGWSNSFNNIQPSLKNFDLTLTKELFTDVLHKNVKTALEQWRNNEKLGLDYILRWVFGEPFPAFDGLLSKLVSGTLDEQNMARQTITTKLFLTVDDFQNVLMFVKGKYDNDPQTVTAAEWSLLLDLLTQTYLVRSVLGLANMQAQGEDIRDRLAQLGLSVAAFGRLLSVRTLLARVDIPVLKTEWEDFANILTQVKKQRTFATWRYGPGGEKEKGILLAPELFQMPEQPTLTFPPPEPRSFTPWRANKRTLHDWEDMLESRIEQVKTTVAAVERAVSETEEETLPQLRDWLIVKLKAPDKAQWVTDNLLIDAKTDGCQLTTRVSQAIETTQGLLWGVHTGQLTDTHPNLTLEATDFEEEWRWIGSYTTWRSAMFIFLYPENILMPHLRKWQTPGFKKLVETTSGGRRFNPELACQAAQDYSRYFEDVCTLKIEATCQTKTRLHRGDCRDHTAAGESYLFYMFGRGNANRQSVYWSAYDPNSANKDYAQTFWDLVPGMVNVEKIIGSVPYKIGEGNRHIFLFAMTNEKKLVFSKYDLEKQNWEEEPSGDLELPDKSGDCTIVVGQRTTEDWPPELAIQCKGVVYIRRLNKEGSDWYEVESEDTQNGHKDNDDWFKFAAKHYEKNISSGADKLTALIDFGSQIGVFIDRGNDLKLYRIYLSDYLANKFKLFFELSEKYNKGTSRNWIGAYHWKMQLFRFTKKAGAINFPGESHVDILEPNGVSINHSMMDTNGVEEIVPNTGYVPDSENRYALGRRLDGYYLFRIIKNGDYSTLQLVNRINPDAPDSFDIVEIIKNKSQYVLNTALSYGETSTGPKTNLIYLEEAYYFVHVHFALQLQKAGHYIEALNWLRNVYDYSDNKLKKIYIGLVGEEYLNNTYHRNKDWLLDPLNPHNIAAVRRNTYTRFTLLCLIRCFLDYADAEFTQDTAESVPRARALYQTALELLALPELNQKLNDCDALIGKIYVAVGNPKQKAQMDAVKKELSQIDDIAQLANVAADISEILSDENIAWETRIHNTNNLLTYVKANQSPQLNLGGVINTQGELFSKAHASLITDPIVAGMALSAADQVSMFFTNAGEDPDVSEYNPLWELDEFSGYTPAPSHHFCIPPNPVIEALRLRAELNLYKIRTCRNIAGMERQLEPYAAPTDTFSGMPQIGVGGQLVLPGAVMLQPTPYRYQILIERARQLVELAVQMESAMLSALEKRDAEYYNLLKARQDVRLARAGVRLQELRVREAESGEELANLQQERAELQIAHYEKLLEEPISELEQIGLDLMRGATALHAGAAVANFVAAALPSGFGKEGPQYNPQGAANSVASGLASLAAAASTLSGYFGTMASYSRRAQEWSYQKSLAEHDLLIGTQQIRMAQDHVRVVSQERNIAEMQADHAKEVMEFLANKFTSVELYAWMGEVLERVYGYFLHQATSMAQLAAQQLAFERQEAPPPFILADYWQPPSNGLDSGSDDGGVDRRGLTGSARLLQDIYKLDQYAFDTDKRKLQLTKTISLARLAPVEFQQFRTTGVLNFATPMELFDRDFPGHYLRLIKRVQTSTIALIPTTDGIRATLSALGLSRVVIGNNGLYQTATVKRPPESVALTSPINATGLFELTPQPDEMLLPFEGMGVDTSWELRMPKASNLFDYSTIADVLLTIEYTALNDFTYQQQVIYQLDTDFSAERPFSFRHEFADQWYDLHNPELTSKPMTVTFRTRRQDFPPNVENLKIQHVVLYFVRQDKNQEEVQVSYLKFNETDQTGFVGGGANSIEGIISTRRGNAGSWTAMLGKSPIGDWELTLPNTAVMKQRFKDEEIEDILFVITYKGHTPSWPA